jgi:hypothetical protein
VRVRLVSGVVFTIAGTIGNADAGYLIRLKNGNEYVTNRYWQQGSQILFDTYGGVFGIENGSINKIEPADQLTRVAGMPDRDSTEKSQTDVKAEDRTKIGEPGTQEGKVAGKRDPNDPIIGEFNQLKKQSAEVTGMLTEEIRELLKRITMFKNKVSKDSKLFFQYAREFNDAQEIGNSVETALRTRTQ